jgi:hypothetical protein
VKTHDKLARSVYRVTEVDDFRGARSASTPLCKQSESSELQDDAGLADTALRAFRSRWRSCRGSLERARDAGCDRLGAGAGELRLVATCGSAETGSLETARMPAGAIPIVGNVVATGRAMNGADGSSGQRVRSTPRPSVQPRLESSASHRYGFHDATALLISRS